MIMWGHPALICALLASAILLRRMPLMALAVTLAGLVASAWRRRQRSRRAPCRSWSPAQRALRSATWRRHAPAQVSVTGVAMAGAGLPILILELPSPDPRSANGSSGTPVPIVTIAVPLVMIIAWLIGNSIRQAQARAELVRAQAAAQTVLAERLRIARELHDMVAHSIGIIAIQAGSGRRVFDASPAEARDALAAIEATSRETLSGLRRMMTGLRRAEPGTRAGAGAAGPGARPGRHRAAGRHDPGRGRAGRGGMARQPGAAAGGHRPVGVPHHPGGGHQRGPPCRHGPVPGLRSTSRTGSCRSRSPTAGAAAAPAAGTGYGITGMRERAALLGGDFSAGPRPGGGFRVAARLPVPAPAR